MASMGWKNAARNLQKRQYGLDGVPKCCKKTPKRQDGLDGVQTYFKKHTNAYVARCFRGGGAASTPSKSKTKPDIRKDIQINFEIKIETRSPKRHTKRHTKQRGCTQTFVKAIRVVSDKPHMYMCGTTLVYIYIYNVSYSITFPCPGRDRKVIR